MVHQKEWIHIWPEYVEKDGRLKKKTPPDIKHKIYVYRMSLIHKKIKILGIYIGNHKKVALECMECNNNWSAIPSSSLRGAGCKVCRDSKRGNGQYYTHEQYLKKMSDINPNITVKGKYFDSKTKVLLICNICTHTWSAQPDSSLGGCGCAKCSKNLKKTNKEYLELMTQKHPTIKVIGKYINARRKVDLFCMVCGYEWSTVPDVSLNQGCGCGMCVGKVSLSHEIYISRMDTIHLV